MTQPREARSRGQGLVETALVIPLVVFVIMLVVDLGLAVYGYNTIANAARQGARVAAVNQLEYSTHDAGSGLCQQDRPVQDPANAYWSIKDCTAHFAISLGIPATSVAVSYWRLDNNANKVACGELRIGCIARVAIDYAYSPFTPFVSTIVNSISMSAASEMPIERVFP